MKKLLPLLLILALLLSSCGHREEPDPPQDPPPETEEPSGDRSVISAEDPLELDVLRVEITRGGLTSERLMEAARELPELLRDALAVHGVCADMVQVTIGSSPAATVQALNEGTVDIAILPAEGFAGRETEAEVLLVSGPGTQDPFVWRDRPVGYQAGIWTAPTDYGLRLAGRVGKEGEPPAWEELDHARWGLLGPDDLPGRRAVDLWLADHCEGRTTADLSDVTAYEDFGQLVRAAEAGEIDVFPWPWEAFARDGEQPPLPSAVRIGETEWFYDMAAAVSPKRQDLSDPGLELRDPLILTLTMLCWHDGTQVALDRSPIFPGNGYDRKTLALCRDVLGSGRYRWAQDGDLDAMRRLLALEGRIGE